MIGNGLDAAADCTEFGVQWGGDNGLLWGVGGNSANGGSGGSAGLFGGSGRAGRAGVSRSGKPG